MKVCAEKGVSVAVDVGCAMYCNCTDLLAEASGETLWMVDTFFRQLWAYPPAMTG